uniref:Transposable element Hobo transposase n=1 Tax=Sipha flava TaxID=143950 RepID=A0A2S2RAL7_9HEMI
MWTDNYRKNSYMSITLHYIDSNWELNNRLLMTGQFPSYETKTGENIKRFMSNFFCQISESASEVNNDLMSCVTFVTDQGSNMLSALRNYNRLNCCANLLNTVLRNLFDIKFLEQEEEFEIKPLEPILTLMIECKNLVKYMKSSGRNCELSKGLVQEIETRWNTRLLMFQSVHRALPEIIQIHGEDFGRIKNINTDLLKQIIQFLETFKKASDDLEGDKCSTIHKAILY